MELEHLLHKPLPKIPDNIKDALNKNRITKTKFENKNDILESEELQNEIGYTSFEDGSYLVSMVCPMPGITADMIEWWFWWHAQDSLRYQIWYPSEHINISYSRKDKAYFQQSSLPSFSPNTHYPVERIGGIKMPLQINFTDPEDFGFSASLIEKNNFAKIICGHVGAFYNLVRHTEMAHMFRKTDDGLFMISRFWIGKTMKNPFLRKIIISEDMARSMAEHCCIEYRNLAKILPELYNEYK